MGPSADSCGIHTSRYLFTLTLIYKGQAKIFSYMIGWGKAEYLFYNNDKGLAHRMLSHPGKVILIYIKVMKKLKYLAMEIHHRTCFTAGSAFTFSISFRSSLPNWLVLTAAWMIWHPHDFSNKQVPVFFLKRIWRYLEVSFIFIKLLIFS